MEKNLTIKLRNGDKEAYAYLFDKYFKELCVFAFRQIKDIETSKDIVQELFYNLYKCRETLNIPSYIREYLYKAVNNLCINYLKHQKIKNEYIETSLKDHQSNFDYNRVNQEKELLDSVNDCIENLPEKTKTIFKLNRFNKLKYAEIASRLGVSEKTIEYHMSNALEILSEAIKKTVFV